MAYSCDYCFKGVQYGETHTHRRGIAGNRWKKRAQSTRKVFRPNLHYRRIEVEGKVVRVRLCTKCLRKVAKRDVPVVATA